MRVLRIFTKLDIKHFASEILVNPPRNIAEFNKLIVEKKLQLFLFKKKLAWPGIEKNESIFFKRKKIKKLILLNFRCLNNFLVLLFIFDFP